MRNLAVAFLTCIPLLSAPIQAKARVMAPPSLPERLARADCVVTGKVSRLEDKTITTPDGVEYQIAVIEVDETIKGKKELTHIRVGFVPGQGAGRRGPRVELKAGFKGCFFLTQLPGVSFYHAPMYFDVVARETPDFVKEIALLNRCGKLLQDDASGLKSKKPEDRFLTAVMLIVQYRTPPGVPSKQVPIDAAQSKAILLALADIDWKIQDPLIARCNPQTMFYRLGITPQDGFERPKNFQDFPDAARKWLRANAGTYRIKRFAPAS